MPRLRLTIALAAALAAAAPTLAAPPPGPTQLVRAYPDHVREIHGGWLVMRDGRRFRLSDGIEGKTGRERAARPDIDDLFAEPYPRGRPSGPPTANPGLVRHEGLFTAMYGDCTRKAVRLRPVRWMPGRGGGVVMFTSTNGAADALERVVRDLEKLPPSMTRFLVPVGGTHHCRKVGGSARRSMHAYGAAIDLAVRHADYWVWAGGEDAPYRNRIPWEIVEAFERHGFIWGGKWRHFDTMHFEYRPELLPPRRR